MTTDTLKQELIETVLKMNALGLNHGAVGNASVRVEGGFIITPSGIAYDELHVDDIVTMHMDGTATGKWNPSSEWRFHLDIYKTRPDISAIVHTHGNASAALSCLRKDIPPFHYMIAVAGGNTIRCAEYATFATKALSDSALKALKGRKACLLANHGQISCGDNLKQALSLTGEVEFLSDAYLRLLQSGAPFSLLDDDEMERVKERFANGYGEGNVLDS